MVLVSTRFSAVKAAKVDDLVCSNPAGLPTTAAGSCTFIDSCFCSTSAVAAGGCIGANACDFSFTSVAANACVGENACRHAVASVGAASCIGENSCQGTVATVGAGSCIGLGDPGDSPCGGSKGIIAAGACIGNDSCLTTGVSANVGAGACIGQGTNCHCLNILVGAISCNGEDACVGTLSGSIGAGSCANKGACYRTTGAIAAASCTGENSCYKAAGAIGAGSCTGEGSCWGTTSTFSSAAGSCTGKNSCRCSSSIMAASACTTEDSCGEICDIGIEDTDAEAAIFCPSRFNTPPACSADIELFHMDGITTVDPGEAIWILAQDTESVTVRLSNAWTGPSEGVDKIYYTYKDSAFSETCHTATDTLGLETYDDITIHCNHKVPFAQLDICVVDSAFDSVEDNAEIAPCCYPDSPQVTPAVCYKFIIHCESKCAATP